MIYKVHHDFSKSQPSKEYIEAMFGEYNRVLVEANSEEHLIDLLKNKYHLNPFYLKWGLYNE